MLQELAAHSLTSNITIASKHIKGGAGDWSILEDKISRYYYKPINGDTQRVPDCKNPKFRYANIWEKSVGGLKVALSAKARKRLTKSLHLKGGSEA